MTRSLLYVVVLLHHSSVVHDETIVHAISFVSRTRREKGRNAGRDHRLTRANQESMVRMSVSSLFLPEEDMYYIKRFCARCERHFSERKEARSFLGVVVSWCDDEECPYCTRTSAVAMLTDTLVFEYCTVFSPSSYFVREKTCSAACCLSALHSRVEDAAECAPLPPLLTALVRASCEDEDTVQYPKSTRVTESEELVVPTYCSPLDVEPFSTSRPLSPSARKPRSL